MVVKTKSRKLSKEKHERTEIQWCYTRGTQRQQLLPSSLTCSPSEPGRCEGGRRHGLSSELAPAVKVAVVSRVPHLRRRRRFAHFRVLGKAASCSKLLEASTLNFGPGPNKLKELKTKTKEEGKTTQLDDHIDPLYHSKNDGHNS